MIRRGIFSPAFLLPSACRCLCAPHIHVETDKIGETAGQRPAGREKSRKTGA